MDPTLTLSDAARTTAGTLLVTIVLVELGGLYLLRLVTGRQPATAFQKAFARAGHAHAGVLVSLALIAQLLADGAALEGPAAPVARSGIALAAILMPAGFFLSSAGSGRAEPNRFVLLVYAGAISLGAGALTLGLALLT